MTHSLAMCDRDPGAAGGVRGGRRVAEFEEVRREGSAFIALLASHVRAIAAGADAATRRVATMEREAGTA